MTEPMSQSPYVQQQRSEPPSDGSGAAGSALVGWCAVLIALGVATILAGIGGGVALALHQVTVCTTDGFGQSCASGTHPLAWAGLGVGFGGLVFGVLVVVVGMIGDEVAMHRRAA